MEEAQTYWDPEPDPQPRRRRTAWIALGTASFAGFAVFLALIGTSLTRIDSDLRTTGVAVDGMSGRAQGVPAQLERVNRSLAIVEAALQVLPRDTEKIAANLGEIVAALELVRSDLSGAAPRLANTAENLEPSAEMLAGLGTSLERTTALLERILRSTGGVGAGVEAIRGNGRSGLSGVRRDVVAVNSVLRGVRGDLGDIGDTGERINGHLRNVCRSPAVTLRGGAQPC
ncbi:MAG: hypothetical protein ACT4QF_11220 [Sporichthyaceae bacterium]